MVEEPEAPTPPIPKIAIKHDLEPVSSTYYTHNLSL
jgi:hypothetical protein